MVRRILKIGDKRKFGKVGKSQFWKFAKVIVRENGQKQQIFRVTIKRNIREKGKVGKGRRVGYFGGVRKV